MTKLTEQERAEVVSDFASGKSKTEIARKFNLSVTAISKILSKFQSLKNDEKFSSKPNKKFSNSKEVRKEIIEKATTALYEKDFEQLPPETLLKIIERLSILEPQEDGDGKARPVIEFVFKDTSHNGADNNTEKV